MTGGEPVCTEPVGVVEADTELDLPVAQDVWIGRPPRGVLVKEILEDPVAVLPRETHLVQRDVDRVADAPRILEVIG